MILESVRSFFQNRLAHPEEQHSPDRVAIAACALLLEIAHADGLGAEELESILRSVREDLAVPEADVRDVLRLAEDARRESVDLYQFTRLIGESFSLEQRRRLVEAIWRVVYSDGALSAVENQLARRISELLGLQQPDIQAARERVLATSGLRAEPPV
jgi:uncharacterized tellurite resistance protein B-like protein